MSDSSVDDSDGENSEIESDSGSISPLDITHNKPTTNPAYCVIQAAQPSNATFLSSLTPTCSSASRIPKPPSQVWRTIGGYNWETAVMKGTNWTKAELKALTVSVLPYSQVDFLTIMQDYLKKQIKDKLDD